MKKNIIAIALVTAFSGIGIAQAADVTAQAVATWAATAKKDTSSKLVVHRLKMLEVSEFLLLETTLIVNLFMNHFLMLKSSLMKIMKKRYMLYP